MKDADNRTSLADYRTGRAMILEEIRHLKEMTRITRHNLSSDELASGEIALIKLKGTLAAGRADYLGKKFNGEPVARRIVAVIVRQAETNGEGAIVMKDDGLMLALIRQYPHLFAAVGIDVGDDKPVVH